MKFSFVLPAYKGRYLREAIHSILSQSYTDFELIVVDDCSPDNLFEIVSEFNDYRLSYKRNDHNIGGTDLVAQWNYCLSFANGEYIILATDDDLYDSDFLSTFFLLTEKYPKVDLFRARILQIDSQNVIKQIDSCYKEYLSSMEFLYHMLHGMKGGIPQIIFKRDVLVEKGGFVDFPMAWGSDDATALMMSEHGVVTSQEHLVRFRWSDINISNDRRYGLEKFKARLLFSRWLKEYKLKLCDDGEWKDFYKRTIVDFLPIYFKVSLISTMDMMSWMHWTQSLYSLCQCDFFTSKDKCSIILRSLKKKLHM